MLSDQLDRKRALDTTQSFIVQAPAGSGKTTLIMQRFLKLLLTVNRDPEECVAITFTNKAAAEMRHRIQVMLKNAQEGHDAPLKSLSPIELIARQVLQRSEANNWQLLDNPSRLRIMTVDALCASLVRQQPLTSQLGAAAELCPEPKLLYQAAVESGIHYLLRSNPSNQSIICLLKHCDNNLELIKNLLTDLLPMREQWLPILFQFDSSIAARKQLEQGLRLSSQLHLSHLSKLIGNELVEICNYAKSAALYIINNTNIASPITACIDLTNHWPEFELSSLPIWLGLIEICFNQQGKVRKTLTIQQGFPAASLGQDKEEQALFKSNKASMLALLHKLEASPELCQQLYKLKILPPQIYSEAQWQVLESLLEILPIMVAELNLQFKAKGQVDFNEITIKACQALGQHESPSELALALDYKIQHLLIDEYQDISLAQARLIEGLSLGWQINDGRTLFLVGDPQQSIYRFRQANVGLFLQTRQYGLANIDLQALTLCSNFRSHAQVIAWLSPIFAKAMPSFEDADAGAVPFSPSVAANQSITGLIEAKAIPLFDKMGQNETELIVKQIQKVKELEPSDSIAILVRNRSHLKKILPALKANFIDYQGIDIEPLYSRAVIKDLISLTRAMMHFGDRLAWLAILRAPWCGLELSDLYMFSKPKISIWLQLQSYESVNCSPKAKLRLAKLVKILNEQFKDRQRGSMRDWIKNTWLKLHGPACLIDDDNEDDAEQFFCLLDNFSTQEFDFEQLNKSCKSLYASYPNTRANPVQIMTIHKAKGLEFDTVIIAGMGQRPRFDQDKMLLWRINAENSVQNTRLLLAPIKARDQNVDSIYAYLKAQLHESELHESLRLLYVGATRAIKRLYFFGEVKIKTESSKAELMVYPGSLLSLIWPTVKEQYIQALQNLSASTAGEPLLEAERSNNKQLVRLADIYFDY